MDSHDIWAPRGGTYMGGGAYMGWVLTWVRYVHGGGGGCLHGGGTYMGGAYMGWVFTRGVRTWDECLHGVGAYMGWVRPWVGYVHGGDTYTGGGGGGGDTSMGWVLTQGRYVHGVGAYTGWVLTQENMVHVFTEHSMAYCVFQPVNSGENTACSPVFMLFVRLV